MMTISIVRESGPATVWARVYPLGILDPESPGSFTFEILERDAGRLDRYLGEKHLLSADAGQVFWGELVQLQPCTSTSPGLAMLRDRPALKGELRIYPDTITQSQ